MKLLILSESPLDRMKGDYFAVDPWIRIPIALAENVEKVTLWAPVAERRNGYRLPTGAWEVPFGKLLLEPLDPYCRFVQFYRLLLKRYFQWRHQARRLLLDHDLVYIRAPSPLGPWVTRWAGQLKRPVVTGLLLNMETQADRVIRSRGIRRLLYRTLVGGLIRQEKFCVNRSDLVYVYSRELADRHRDTKTPIRFMQDPHLRSDHFYYREDTCLSDEIRLLRLCWLIPSKGVEVLIDSVARLRTEGFPVRLEIVGKERDPGYQKTLEECAARLGILPYVDFSGWLPFDRTAEAYKRSDIQVLSSLGEGTPRCVVEGFARGLPLVCTAVGGCRDTLVHERDALLVPAGDPQAIAGAVKRIVRERDLRQRLIHEGYERAKEATFEYTGERFIKELEEVVRRGAS